jgi:hypothetical protein
MKTYTPDELKAVLAEHGKWLSNKGGQRADLRGSDLRGCDLHGSNLRGCDLHGSNLRDSILRNSDLRNSNLRGCDLHGSNLHGSNLHGSNLRDSILRNSDLRNSDLSHSDLRGSDLSGASGRFSVFYGGQHHGVATCSHIAIGCERHTHTEWRNEYVAIGKEASYTKAEIERYRQWIFSLDWLMEDAPVEGLL